MDGTTEPILAVIGHPIAGNPTQFAAERALRALKLDWRVLSFDVKPEDLPAALSGFSVTGIDGVIIDETLATEAEKWQGERSGGAASTTIDCLTRDEDFQFVGRFEQRRWVDEQVSRHGGQRFLWLGDRSDRSIASGEGFEIFPSVPDEIVELAGQVDVIVIERSAGKQLELDTEDWAPNEGSTLVVDLTDGHPEIAKIRQLGYRVIGENERRIGTLQSCLHAITGQFPSAEVIYDAIEEYLGV